MTLAESIAWELRSCLGIDQDENEIPLANGTTGFVDGISEAIAGRVSDAA